MKIDFEYDTKYGKFSDSLNLPDDQIYTEAEIEGMKETRRDAWVSYIDNAPINEPHVEESPLEG